LAPFIASRLSGKKVERVSYQKSKKYLFLKNYITVGSIIKKAMKNSIVWGSGIIEKNEMVEKATFLAVRGPKTRNRLLELGYKVPEIYGDPALLLPTLIKDASQKKYELGIIPHYVDFDKIHDKFSENKDYKVINLITHDVVKTTQEILECKRIVSSSLHGVIVPQAYNIPALWVKFSDNLSGDNIKFYDYFESVGIQYEKEFSFDVEKDPYDKFEKLLLENKNKLLADAALLKLRKQQLLESCPFKNRRIMTADNLV
jgi:hypothetical protein